MTEYTLQRTGRPALRFTGEQIAASRSPPECGPRGTRRWHEVRVYRTRQRSLVLEVEYGTTWDDEGPRSHAETVADGERGLVAALQRYDPTEPIVGYPPGAQFAERQQRLLAHHRAVWQDCCDDVISQLGIVEEVP